MVHAQLDHGHAVVATQIEQGQRHANVVVQIALGRQGIVTRMGAQDAGDHLGHSGFAVAAGHRDDGQIELRAPACCQFAQSDARIGHHQSGQTVYSSLRLARGLTHHRNGTLCFGLGDELVAVKTLATQSNKQIARLQAAAVGVHAIGHCTLKMDTTPLAEPTQGQIEFQMHSSLDGHACAP